MIELEDGSDISFGFSSEDSVEEVREGRYSYFFINLFILVSIWIFRKYFNI